MKVEFIEIGKEYSIRGSRILQKHEEKQHGKSNLVPLHISTKKTLMKTHELKLAMKLSACMHSVERQESCWFSPQDTYMVP